MTVIGGVPRSGEEIPAALTAFATRWKSYQGTQRAEAQTFLNELFACSADRNAVGAKLEEPPDRYESLMFLAAPTLVPSFVDHYRELTKEATASIALLYQSLKDRSAPPIDEIQRFTLQCVWSLFAEDLGMLDGYPCRTSSTPCSRTPRDPRPPRSACSSESSTRRATTTGRECSRAPVTSTAGCSPGPPRSASTRTSWR